MKTAFASLTLGVVLFIFGLLLFRLEGGSDTALAVGAVLLGLSAVAMSYFSGACLIGTRIWQPSRIREGGHQGIRGCASSARGCCRAGWTGCTRGLGGTAKHGAYSCRPLWRIVIRDEFYSPVRRICPVRESGALLQHKRSIGECNVAGLMTSWDAYSVTPHSEVRSTVPLGPAGVYGDLARRSDISKMVLSIVKFGGEGETRTPTPEGT